MATPTITVYTNVVPSPSLAASVDDVMEKTIELRVAKRAKIEADQTVANLLVRQRDLEQALATAKTDQIRCQHEESYCAGELAHACKEWLVRNQAD